MTDHPRASASASDRLRPRHLSASELSGGYDRTVVLHDVTVQIPAGSFTAIIGPNACGKSTLLRMLARLLKPRSGTVRLDGIDIRDYAVKRFAQQLGLLPQAPIAPEGITVAELIARGRHPHQGVLAQWSQEDERAVDRAMRDTGVLALAERPVAELSGGQRQRVWIAMSLAQETPILLLDEPTTYLDIAHQLEVLELVARLKSAGRTIVAVLHDLNQAASYADHLIAMRDGVVVAQGPPRELITEATIERVFGLISRVITDPDTGAPIVLPRAQA
ncbi:iron complex transport system ATP-binding protein [Leucobacter luti]|uniref:ABC transporter ATP-binding protein n=1 Tax=Leucobacter luti TaxID=340320 RepID=UPI00104AA309|nr:ABC transporter ATP-binding protein [Leucobacter luti]MCW2289054.1 iron complex transport system ATP-binding protein [Leucobacter luti]TCK35545.1 iron complex transport system ATP-binding protein [Leucobacter luti]